MTYSIYGKTLFALSDLIELSEFSLASFIPAQSLQSIFDGLYYTDAQLYMVQDTLYVNVRLAFEVELALSFPGLSGLSLVAGADGDDWTSLQLELVIGPEPRAEISDIPLLLRIDQTILKPMISPDEVDTSKTGVEIPLGTFTLIANSSGFFPEAELVATLPLSMILDTGLLIQADGIHIVFCDSGIRLQELDPSFRGVFIKESTIYLPKSWYTDTEQGVNAKIVGQNLAFGTDGEFSGQIHLDTSQSNLLHTKLPGGFKLGLETFSITFDKKMVTNSDIRGKLSIPGLKAGNGQDDAELIATVTLNNNVYTFTAETQNSLKIGDFQVDLSQCSLTLRDSAIQDVIINGLLTLQGIQDTNNLPAKANVVFTFAQDIYTFSLVSSIPALKVGDFSLIIQHLQLTFDKNGFQSLAASAVLTIPWFDNNGTPCTIETDIAYASSMYSLSCTSAQASASFGGISLSIKSFSGSFDSSHIQKIELAGTVSLPFIFSDEAGTTPVVFSYSILYSNSLCTLTATTDNTPVYLGGYKAFIDTFVMTFNNSGLSTIDLRGTIEIPGLSTQPDKNIGFIITRSGSSYSIALSATGLEFTVGPFTLTPDRLSGTFVNNTLSDLRIHGSISHPDFKKKDNPSIAGSIAVDIAKTGSVYTIALSSSDALVLANLETTFSAFTIVLDNSGVQSLSANGLLVIPGIQTTADPCEFTITKSPADQYLVSLKKPVQNLSMEIFIVSVDSLEAEFTQAALTGFTLSGTLQQESLKDATNESRNAVFSYSLTYTSTDFTMTLSSTPFVLGGFGGTLGLSTITLQNGTLKDCNISGLLKLPSVQNQSGSDASVDFLLSKTAQTYHVSINQATGLSLDDLTLSIAQADVIFTGSALNSLAIEGEIKHPAFKNPSNTGELQNIHYHLSYANQTFSIGFAGDVVCVFGSLSAHLTQLDATFNSTGLVSFLVKGSIEWEGLKTTSGTTARVNFNFEKNAAVYNLILDGNVDVVLDPYTLTLKELSGSFNGAELTGFKLKGTLQHPEFKDSTNTTQPGALAFEITKNSSTYSLTLGGCSFTLADCLVTLSQFNLILDNNGVQSIALIGSVSIPMLQTTSSSGSSGNATFAVTALKDGSNYTFTLGTDAAVLLDLEILSLRLKSFSISFNKTGLTGVALEGELYIGGLHNEMSSGKGILFAGGYMDSIFSLSIESGTTPAAIDLGGVKIEFSSLSFSFSKQGLQSLGFATILKFPGFTNDDGSSPASCALTFVRNADKSISASATGSVWLNLGSIKIELTTVAFTIDPNGKFSPQLAGKLYIDAFTDANGNVNPISVVIDISNGFDITASVASPLKVLDIQNYIDIELSKIRIGRINNIWCFGFAGALHNYIKIPVVEKYLPKAIFIQDFLMEGSDVTVLKFSIEWDSALKVDGDIASGINIYIPVAQSIGGVAYLEAIQVAAKDNNPGLALSVALVGAQLNIGPFTAIVDGLGFAATFTKADDNKGAIGPFNVGMKVLPPKGIGVSLQTSTITAGGYLFFDSENGRYAGAVEISILDKLGITAIGILTTKLPDGSKGISLLLIIGIKFPVPIPLGYNFFIAGVGGLVGLHRTMNVDNMIQGVRTGSIGNVLFPTDVIKNIVKIIGDLESFFPPRKGQFLIGGMAMITWSTPAIVTVEFGLIIEFSDPVRIAILGMARVVLPSKDNALINLQVSFLGVIDFEAGMLTFDASLVNSRILKFTIEGDMAVRLSWGKNKDFLISIGGFHPSYVVPSYLRLPKMRRMTFNFMTGNPRCVLTAYMAVTTNTVQFGASLDFSYSVSKFKAVAFFSLDVLFQFSPFYFIATINCGAAIKWGDTTLMGITLRGSLSGPRPWHVTGSAEFEVLFFSFSVNVDETFGDSTPVTLPDIDILTGITDALSKESAWSIEQSKEKPQLVCIRQQAAAASTSAPAPESETVPGMYLAPTGALVVSQNYAPLGIVLKRFGNAKPHDIQSFTIKSVSIGTETETPQTVKDSFAPAQYLEMSDSEKLRAPAFEMLPSGIKVTATQGLEVAYAQERPVCYEIVTEDNEFNANGTEERKRQSDIIQATVDQIVPFISGGDIGKNRCSQVQKNRKKYPKQRVLIDDEKYVVVDKATLQPVQQSTGVSYLQATAELAAKGNSKYIIVPEYQAVLQV